MSLESLLASLAAESEDAGSGVPPVPAGVPAGGTLEALQTKAVPPVPPVPAEKTGVRGCAPVVRLRLVLEAENGARSEAILEVPAARYDGLRVLELFERHQLAGSTRVVEVRQESADDGRRFCRDCANLRNGVCTAASQIGAQPGYRPLDDVPRRCEAFSERED